MKGWEATSFADLESVPLFEGIVWHPVRRKLGIKAFGMNAYTSEALGELVIEEHDESSLGHEEIYIVIRGRATFTLDGETVDAPAGTLVFLSDPAVKRKAVAEEEGTLVLAVGGPPGVPYEPSPWEWYFAAMPAFREGRWDEAIALMEAGLEEKPGNAAILYNLACAESRAGRTTDALAHLEAAIKGDPKFADRAREDPDFDPIRREPAFPA
jgi:tetratricopeptide (TPR) repeat protein